MFSDWYFSLQQYITTIFIEIIYKAVLGFIECSGHF